MKSLYKRLHESVVLKIFDKEVKGYIQSIEQINDGVIVEIQFSGMGKNEYFFNDGMNGTEGCPDTYTFKIGFWNRFLEEEVDEEKEE